MWGPSISEDGRYVALTSYVRHPARCHWYGEYPGISGPNYYYPCGDAFRYDRSTGKTLLVSISRTGGGGNGMSLWPWISGNGRYVAFGSTATNLVSGDTRLSCPADPYSWSCPRIYVRDLVTGTTWRASQSSRGEAGNGDSWAPRVTNTGDAIFVSKANNLVSGDTNVCDQTPGSIYGDGRCPDVFIHERATRQTTRLSVADDGTQASNPDVEDGKYYRGSDDPYVSDDGTIVAFSSDMRNLTAEKKAGAFVLNRDAHHLRWVGPGLARGLSANGRYLADLDAGALRMLDLSGGQSTEIARSRHSEVSEEWGHAWVSSSGRAVAFSAPGNLTATKTPCPSGNYYCTSVYLWTAASRSLQNEGVAPRGERLLGDITGADADEDGRFVVFWSARATYEWCRDSGQCNGPLAPLRNAVAAAYVRDVTAGTTQRFRR